MRIWLLNHYASPPDRAAGTRHYDFGRAFVERGHDVTIFASSFNHFSRREERLSPRQKIADEHIDRVHFVWIRTRAYTRNNFRRIVNVVDYCRRVLQFQHRYPRPDVVVGSSVHLGAVVVALLVAKLRRAEFVFEVRDIWPQTLIDLGALRPDGVAARALRTLERFLYRQAKLIVCLLPGAFEYFDSIGVSRDKVVYVPNASYAEATSQNGSDAESGNAALSEGTRLLLKQISVLRAQGRRIAGYTGTHGVANRVEVLVEAAVILRRRGVENVGMVFVGEGSNKAACQQIAADHRLESVVFADAVPKSEIPALLSSLDITMFALSDTPVFKYGLSSNKLFDYLACGKPTIFAAGVADNPIRAAGSGICIPPDSPERVADALTELAALTDDDRHKLGVRGQRYVREHHDIGVLADRFLGAVASAR